MIQNIRFEDWEAEQMQDPGFRAAVERLEANEARLSELEHGTIHERAAALIIRWGSIDGDHHKQWVLDQVLRILAGAAYQETLALIGDGWSEGIAP